MTRNLVIVGAGLAGAKAAEAARAEGWDGRVVLVGDEPTAPYERPPLSKAILRGEADPGSARVHPAGFYRDHDIELVTGDVGRIDARSRRVLLAGGEHLDYDTLVVATGAEPLRLPAPWDGMSGVPQRRTLEDALRLHDALRRATRVAVSGAG
ncbi:MAG TPA: FAD-dependent oxidoreductase, partial [Acidimicrobiales bacterium]|nr:FAD-dependent oxidoreductase [Acidimicrobiales bacterium]